jgi:hypothetical protein
VSRAFTDRYGTELGVGGEASFAGCARVTVSQPCGIHVEVADFPALIASLYEAASVPVPVILERPEIVPDGDGETGINIFTVKMEPHLGSVGIRYHGAPCAAVIAPGPARLLASVIAAYADAAEAARELDPDDVAELTQELWDAMKGGPAEAAARAALRWFRDKQQQGKADG